MNKITCICLGVRDVARSIKFYRDGLGYKTNCKENNPPVCFFDTPGTKFELFPLEQLAKDIRASLKTLLDLLRILRNRDARRVFHKSLYINDL